MIGRELPRCGCIRFRCCGSRNYWIPLTIMNACLLVCSCSVLCALPLAFPARSSRQPRPVLDFAVSPRDQAPQHFIPALSVQVCFSPLSPCKNGHPETTRNPSATWLRFQISLSSIDRCPPFRAKRTDRAGRNLRPKTDRRFSRQSRPLARLVQDDGSRKLPQIRHLRKKR